MKEKLFKRYQTVDYLEFLEMSKDEREEWEDAYPKIDVPTEIWKLLGDKIDIYFYSDKSYELFFEYTPDPEHGLNLMIKDRKNIDLK